MVKPKIHALLVALLLATVMPAWADNSARFKEAATAYQAGNYKQAFRLFQQFADRGDAVAQNNLGMLYAEGLGVAQDYQQAKAWWQKAANQGHAGAQYNLGVMYYEGKGMEKNYQKAKVWWQKVLAQPNTADNTQIKKYANHYLQELRKAGIR